MLKKIITAWFMAGLVLFSNPAVPLAAVPVQAEEEQPRMQRVTDSAGLVSEEKRAELENRAAQISAETGYDIYIVDTDDWTQRGDFKEIIDYAEAIYTRNDFGSGPEKKGILLVISANTYEFAIYANEVPQERLDQIQDAMLEGYNTSGWEGAFDGYLNGCAQYLKNNPDSDPIPDEDVGALNWVKDEENLLTSQQKLELEDQINAIVGKHHFGIYIVTMDDWRDLSDKEILPYAEEYYLSNDLGYGADKDGILLMLSMADRSYAVYSHGPIADVGFTEYAIERLEPVFLDDFKYDDWYEGFEDYVSETEEYLYLTEEGNPVVYNKFNAVNLTIVFGVPLVIAAIVAISFKLQMRSVFTSNASEYAAGGGLKLTGSRDVYTHTTTVRHKIEKESSGGGSSGLSSGHGSSGHF